MSRIKLLDKNVYNQIAAGEVIERPQSVVKELVENSIDAGAKNIQIKIEGSGFQKIEVSDDGCGIHADQLELAFVKHATSKIDKYLDLFTISSMGFRGEALASIGAVAQVKIVSRTQDDEYGTAIEFVGGESVRIYPEAHKVGTTVTVENLFFNVPARRKFLKTDRTETSKITNYVSKMILSQPNLVVKYTVDDELIYFTQGAGKAEAIFTVYGTDYLDNCLPVENKYKDITLIGYIGKTEFLKPNSTYQTFTVNGRIVNDTTLSTAVRNAYSKYIVGGKAFPFCSLDITLPPSQVDVNVHPTKTEVRFVSPGDVFKTIYYAIEKKLRLYTEWKIEKFARENPGCMHPEIDKVDHDFQMRIADMSQSVHSFMKDGVLVDKEGFERNMKFKGEILKKELEEFAKKNKQEDAGIFEIQQEFVEEDGMMMIPIENSVREHRDEIFNGYHLSPVDRYELEKTYGYVDTNVNPDKLRIVGRLFYTYIIVESGESVLLIDQHAGHERILYDKFMKQSSKRMALEKLVFPYVFSVSEKENEFLNRNIQVFRDVGIIMEDFGNKTYRITEMSTLFKGMSLGKLVDSVLASYNDLYLEKEDVVKDVIAKKACRTAAKAGDCLTNEEVKYLVTEMLKTKSYTCPHGRPVVHIVTKTELEKTFKRKL